MGEGRYDYSINGATTSTLDLGGTIAAPKSASANLC